MDSTLCTVKMAEATHYVTQWNNIELCFFCRLYLSKQAFLYVSSLSKSTAEGPSTGIPNIFSFHMREIINSEANRKVMNSEPKVNISTVFWRLEYRKLIVLLIVTMPETILCEYQKLAYYYTWTVHPLSGTLNVKIQLKYRPLVLNSLPFYRR